MKHKPNIIVSNCPEGTRHFHGAIGRMAASVVLIEISRHYKACKDKGIPDGEFQSSIDIEKFFKGVAAGVLVIAKDPETLSMATESSGVKDFSAADESIYMNEDIKRSCRHFQGGGYIVEMQITESPRIVFRFFHDVARPEEDRVCIIVSKDENLESYLVMKKPPHSDSNSSMDLLQEAVHYTGIAMIGEKVAESHGFLLGQHSGFKSDRIALDILNYTEEDINWTDDKKDKSLPAETKPPKKGDIIKIH